MAQTPQTHANHGRIIPLYHGFVLMTFVANLAWAVRQVIVAPGVGTALALLMAAALIILSFYVRIFALKVQDRVIRLEMRLRLKDILPAPLQSRIAEFSPGQLVAMRFASDAELPALAEQVLRDNIQDKKAIKQMVRDWQADYLRA
jgi:hypothetical protein